MKNFKTFGLLLGLVFALPWYVLIVSPSLALKSAVVQIRYGDGDGATQNLYPNSAGVALYGSEVYAQEGCAYCHTQMIRPTDNAGEGAGRGWSGRQEAGLARRTLPYDYIGEQFAHLGYLRNGPDLSNVGYRIKDAQSLLQHLYDPRSVQPLSTMPAYRWLFQTREVIGVPSDQAVKVYTDPESGALCEVTPTSRAKALAAYLLSMKKDQQLPMSVAAQIKNKDD